jgi:Protein of unknown function (DUF3060)
MRRQLACAVSLLALLAACTESPGSSSPTPTSPSAGPTTTASSEAPAAGACPVGDWQVTTITGKSGANVGGAQVVARSGSGFTLSLTPSGTWTLKGDNATVTLDAAGVSVQATVAGTAEGDYAKLGTDYQFRQQRATGKVTLTQPIAGVSSFSMDQVGPALAPAGKATLTCGPGTLQLTSESVTLDLKSTGSPTTPTTPTTGGGSSGGGGTLTIEESAQTRTIDCAGRDVALNGSANKLTFTGTCGTVSVNGSKNDLTLATAAQISVNGSQNKVTYTAGNPKIANNGTGNTISKG